jgi:thioredoxin 2
LAEPRPIDISDKIFAKLQSRDEWAYVLDVWAPWCGPCRMMAPSYAESAQKFDGDIRFFKLNSEEHPQGSARLNVRGIPALFFFNRGKLVSQKSGALPEHSITKWVRESFASS